MIEALAEAFGRLTEQEISLAARNRIQNLAAFSGFQHYVDPSGGLDMGGSIHDRSIYRSSKENDLVISVDFNPGDGILPWSGSISFMDTIPGTNIVFRRISHPFISDGEARTVFTKPRNFTMGEDSRIEYPVDMRVAPAQDPLSDESRMVFITEEDGELVTEPADAQVTEHMRKHWEDMIIDIMNRRTPKEVAENRIRLARLIGHIDAIHPERDLIVPPPL